jgi:hypothetical protein
MYKINGTNLFDSCGFLADKSRDSSGSFERLADPADVFSHTWENGNVDWDLNTVPGKKPRTFKLVGYITATSEADYFLKKDRFEVLIRSRIAVIYNDQTGTTVNAKLSKIPVWDPITGSKGRAIIYTKISCEFDELVGIALPVYGLYFGASSAVPTTTAMVTALTAGPFATTIDVQTGTTNRVISIAIPEGHSITSVTDLDNPLFPAVTYTLQGTIVVGSVNYYIYSLQLGAPYSTNHRHRFIIA